MDGPVAMLAATVLIGTVAAVGCGIGPGAAQEGQADLRVTREFGAAELVHGTLQDPTPSDTVVRFLDDQADIETSYSGNFVESIDGLSGSTVNGGSEDWFFFVNGYYSDIGAGESQVHPGDRIWWDYRRWAEAYRVPAVVGSWPEPFLHGRDGTPLGVVVECLRGSDGGACDDVIGSLDAAGVDAQRETPSEPVAHPDELRVLVGPWGQLRGDPAASQIEDGPSTSGVYADVVPCGDGYRLDVLGSDGKARERLDSAGLVAAVREGDDQPTWVVTGTDEAGAADAAAVLDEADLGERYAVATAPGGESMPVPAPDDLPATSDSGACR
jgi:hypothetical protein